MSSRPATRPRTESAPLAHELRVVVGQLVRRLRAQFRLPLMHATVLGRLDREGPLGTVELAKAEDVRPQSMGQTLAELEAQGLIDRRPDPGDRRKTLLALTDVGRRLLIEERGRREGWLAQALEDEFTEAERRTLKRAAQLLTRLPRA